MNLSQGRLLFVGVVILHLICFLGPANLWASLLPDYQIQVHYDDDAKKLHGTMKVSVSTDQSLQPQWVFALPMNRFVAPDPRGPRRIDIPPVFSRDDYRKAQEDPLFPKGFSQGKMTVHSVKDIYGQKLSFQVLENPDLPVGYSTQDGLLKVQAPLTPESTVVIEFETLLPQRFQEGVVKGDLVTSEWHPKLVDAQNPESIAGFEPVPGTYQVSWSGHQKRALDYS
jgi:hypothetical protein